MVIRVEALDLGYEDRLVLAGLNFRVKRGEFVGILGPNGSGKSTLLHALSGLLRPLQGRIVVKADALGGLPSRLRAQILAVVPQSTDVRFPFSCLEIVLMGRYPHRRRLGTLTDTDLVQALKSMRRTTTVHLKDRSITEVSGGECQRVVIARALAQDPEILLLDEATSSLDVRKKLEIFEVLKYLNKTKGLTVLCAMHDLNLAALYCERLMFIKDGQIVVDGPTDQVFTPEILGQVYETRMEVIWHPVHKRPYAVMLPLSSETVEVDEAEARREAARL
ncbi:MAG: ABC transporter ATP-binding protein [Thermodesulfobacteriota bacterium]